MALCCYVVIDLCRPASRAADLLLIGARSEAVVDPCMTADPNDLLMQAGRPLVIGAASRHLAGPSERAGGVEGREGNAQVGSRRTADPFRCQGGYGCWKFRKRKSIAAKRCRMSRTWRPGWPTTGSWRPRWFRKRQPILSVELDGIAGNVGAGIVIAGAYGHSRLREWVMGGVTRHLVAESSRCSFLSR